MGKSESKVASTDVDSVNGRIHDTGASPTVETKTKVRRDMMNENCVNTGSHLPGNNLI